ncbi:L-threonylcarbamoyladenylate synthase [Methylothermus subterraneus]
MSALESTRQDQEAVERAAWTLRRGGLVAFPTETVYGLGADAANPQSVARVFAVKGRPADHPLIVHLPGSEALLRFARRVPPVAWELAERFWPGPLTLLLPRAPAVPDSVTGGQDTVGLRVPAHPLALALLKAFGGGVAAPSANRFGRVSPTTAAHVREELGEAVDFLLDGGPCPLGLESTILDLSSARPRLLRLGAVSRLELAEVLGELPELAKAHAPRAPGSLPSHYAPATPLYLMASAELVSAVEGWWAKGERLAVLARRPPPDLEGINWVAMPWDPRAYAQVLYARLREADRLGCQRLVVEAPPCEAAWEAILDRLQRAACRQVKEASL